MKRRFLFFITILITIMMLTAFPVFAERVAMPAVSIPTAASNGFGGAHVAYTDNVFALLVNPAAIMQVQQWSFVTLAPSLFSPQGTFSLFAPIADFARGDSNALGRAANTLSEKRGRIPLGAELREFPFSFAWVTNGFGIGLWNRTFVNANIVGTNVEAHIFSDIMLPVGFAVSILSLENHTVDAGLTLKPFMRLRVQERQTILSLMTDGTDDFIDNMNVPLLLGGTFDMGLMYRWRPGLRAGLTFSDIYSHAAAAYNINGWDGNTYYIPFTINAGLAYEFSLHFFKFTLAADWRNITNIFNQDDYFRRNFTLDFGVGLQVAVFDIGYARIGMNEMLPSVGIGVDLGSFKIDMAYYGREFSNEPGQLSAAVVEMSVSFRPDAKKMHWPWAKRSLAGMIFGVEH